MRFGFHAKDAIAYTTITATEELEYYNRTIDELIRITGSTKCIDNFVRLDRFQADSDMVFCLSTADNGIVGLLCADDVNRQSYALSIEELEMVNVQDWYKDSYGLCYTPTDVRLFTLGMKQRRS